MASVRAKDKASETFDWVNPKVVHEFPEGHDLEGHKVIYVDDPADLALLGKRQGHCAGTHFVWACEEKIWYFFAIIGPNGQPHCTVHAKQKKWIGKGHPRDKGENPYDNGGYITCPDCEGYGGHDKNGKPADPYYRDTIRCIKCEGSGRIPDPEKDKVPYPQAKDGGYPTFEDVQRAFESVGKKYEAGKYKPLQFNSQSYEAGWNKADPYVRNWDRVYGSPFTKRDRYGDRVGNAMVKPDFVTDEQWAEFTKLWQSMKAQYDKGVGAIKIQGRLFKFDSKELAILSFSGQGQGAVGNKYRRGFHEFLVELAKKKKEVEVGSQV